MQGHCQGCRHLDTCGGNTRVRAQQLTGNPWAKDPGGYLSDDEVGVTITTERVPLTPFSNRLKPVRAPVVVG